MSKIFTNDVTIASSGTTSGSVWLDERLLVGIEFPSAFTGATVSFEVSADNTNFVELYSGGSLVTVTATASKLEKLVPADYAMAKFIRVKSASSEAAERTITLWTRNEKE